MVNCVSPIPNEMFSDYVKEVQRGLARRKCRHKEVKARETRLP